MYNGDAAEQVVRLSLEGMEVAAKLTGSAAKNIAILLTSVLKQEINQSAKTRGKARLSSMLKSGKELKVFAIPQKNLKKFTEHAKQYGVLYCVLRDKTDGSAEAMIDIIARAEDASKIQRIFDRFDLGKVDKATIVAEAEKDIAEREALEIDEPVKTKGERIVEEAMGKPIQKEGHSQENPTAAKTDKNPPSEQNLKEVGMSTDRGAAKDTQQKPSVKEKLDGYRKAAVKQKESERAEPKKKKETNKSKKNRQTVHKKQRKAKKSKER